MDEDGYLLLRGLLNENDVLAARRHVLEQLASEGQLDESAPLMDGVPNRGRNYFFSPSSRKKAMSRFK